MGLIEVNIDKLLTDPRRTVQSRVLPSPCAYMLASGALALTCFDKETYAPAILRKRVKRLERETDHSKCWTASIAGMSCQPGLRLD